MAYLVVHNGTYWFQIRAPKPLVPTYGALIRQNPQTGERSLAKQLVLRLASRWME